MISVHPRASGERLAAAVEMPLDDGSSPRERGTHLRHYDRPRLSRFIPARAGNATVGRATDGTWCRFIPARAGNATRSTARPKAPAVHPRASGERFVAGYLIYAAGGSSPRERGTLAELVPARAGSRFIPARAGNAPRPRSASMTAAVHPRASGERVERPCFRRVGTGSSPRERGTQFGPSPAVRPRRFIPARAGNALSGRV